MKNLLLCSRKDFLITVGSAVVLFALPLIAVIPYSESALLHTVENNLSWICFFVFVALDIGKRNFGRSLVYGAATAILYIALILYMFFGPTTADYVLRRQFDSATWKAAAWKTSTSVERRDDIRLHMIDDLLHRYNLVGMSRTQIIDLLGPPNPYESKQTSSEYLYYLGPERNFISIDSEWLDIKFQGEKVTSAVDRPD